MGKQQNQYKKSKEEDNQLSNYLLINQNLKVAKLQIVIPKNNYMTVREEEDLLIDLK